MRMGSRLSFAIEVPEALRSRPFPPMMLITLVENAVIHGVGAALAVAEGIALMIANGEVPQLGSHFVMRLNNALPGAFVIGGLGFSNTLAFSGTLPLPFELLLFGAILTPEGSRAAGDYSRSSTPGRTPDSRRSWPITGWGSTTT